MASKIRKGGSQTKNKQTNKVGMTAAFLQDMEYKMLEMTVEDCITG